MMVYLINALIVSGVMCGVMLGAMLFFRRQISHSLGAERGTFVKSIETVTKELEEVAAYSEIYASKAQLETVKTQQETLKGELEKSKELLKEIEKKLEVAQKNVDTKEAQQQELKTAKENEQAKLDEIAGNFEMISSESIELEKQLANSLKQLDTMMTELKMTADQKAVVQNLSNALTSAGARMRDLISEYQTVNGRLEQLKLQHVDLEDEYTRLVEQQLGG